MTMEDHVHIERFKNVVFNVVRLSGMSEKDIEHLTDEHYEILAHLLNNINSRLVDFDNNHDKALYLKSLCINIAASHMIMDKKIIEGLTL